MKLDYVFFDCWDTLIRYKTDGKDFLEGFSPYLEGDYDIKKLQETSSLVTKDYFHDNKYEISFEVLFQIALKLHGIKINLPREKWEETWCVHYVPTPVDGIHDFLDYLKSKGVKMAVLSNTILSSKITIKFIEEALQIKFSDYFEFLLASSEEGPKKPNPLFFQIGMKKAGVEAGQNALYIGDSFVADIIGSSSAGLKPCYVMTRGDMSDDRVRGFFSFTQYKELIKFVEETDSYEVQNCIKKKDLGEVNEW